MVRSLRSLQDRFLNLAQIASNHLQNAAAEVGGGSVRCCRCCQVTTGGTTLTMTRDVATLRFLGGSLLSLALLLGGCESAQTAQGVDAGAVDLAGADPKAVSVFAMDVEVRSPTGAAMAGYVQVIDRTMFDGRKITNSTALEYQGIPRLLTMGGSVFIGPRTEPTLYKFSVDNKLSLQPAGALSVMAYGASFIDIGFIPSITPTKAYYIAGPTQKAVIINPQDMTIQGSFDITGAQRTGFEGASLHQGIFQFEQAVVGNRAFESTLSSASTPTRFYPKLTVSVFDTANDKLLKVIEDDRCYGPSTMVKADNGDVYVSSYSFSGRIYQTAGYEYRPTCVMRIKAGEDEFDPSYFVSFPDLLGGRECVRWYPVNGRYSYCTTIPVADLKVATSTSNAIGQIWKIDLEQKTAKRVDGLPDTTPFITLGYPDSPNSILLGVAAEAGKFDRSLVYRLVPADDGVTKVFEVDGLLRGLWPVR